MSYAAALLKGLGVQETVLPQIDPCVSKDKLEYFVTLYNLGRKFVPDLFQAIESGQAYDPVLLNDFQWDILQTIYHDLLVDNNRMELSLPIEELAKMTNVANLCSKHCQKEFARPIDVVLYVPAPITIVYPEELHATLVYALNWFLCYRPPTSVTHYYSVRYDESASLAFLKPITIFDMYTLRANEAAKTFKRCQTKSKFAHCIYCFPNLFGIALWYHQKKNPEFALVRRNVPAVMKCVVDQSWSDEQFHYAMEKVIYHLQSLDEKNLDKAYRLLIERCRESPLDFSSSLHQYVCQVLHTDH